MARLEWVQSGESAHSFKWKLSIHLSKSYIHILFIFILTYFYTNNPLAKLKYTKQYSIIVQIHHNGLTIIRKVKIKIHLRLFFQGVVFDLLSAHQIQSVGSQVTKRGKF